MSEDVTGRRAAALESAAASDEPVDLAEQAVADRVRALLAHPATWTAPPQAAPVVELARRRARRWSWAAAGAAAAAAVVAAVVALVVALSGTDPQRLELDLAGTALAPGASASVEATRMGPGWELVLDFAELPAAPEGTYYEGWVVRETARVPLGTFHLRQRGEVRMWAGVAIDEFTRVEVTRQRVGGDQQAGEVFLSGPIPRD